MFRDGPEQSVSSVNLYLACQGACMILEYCYLFITKDNKSRHQNRRVNGTIMTANVAGGWGGGWGDLYSTIATCWR